MGTTRWHREGRRPTGWPGCVVYPSSSGRATGREPAEPEGHTAQVDRPTRMRGVPLVERTGHRARTGGTRGAHGAGQPADPDAWRAPRRADGPPGANRRNTRGTRRRPTGRPGCVVCPSRTRRRRRRGRGRRPATAVAVSSAAAAPARASRGEALHRFSQVSCGRGGGIRTHGPSLPKRVRYQAAPHPVADKCRGARSRRSQHGSDTTTAVAPPGLVAGDGCRRACGRRRPHPSDASVQTADDVVLVHVDRHVALRVHPGLPSCWCSGPLTILDAVAALP
jgi:hypothetical protein